MILSDTAIKNRTTVGVLVLLIIVVGVYSYVTLPRESAPDVPIPYILVTTTYEGVSPEDVESAVTMKIEKKLTGLKGVKEVRSSSLEGVSSITVEFLPDIRVEDALQYVRDKVDLAKADLPEDADDPVISEINIAEFPIMMISVTGDISAVQLKAIGDELEDALEIIPGVLKVEVLGTLEREIRLEVDPDRMAAYGLTIPELLTLIPQENVNVSAGGLETPGTRFNVRVPAEFVTPEEVDKLLLTVRDGRPIYLTDVATVRDTFKDRSSYSRLNGTPSITVSVQKRVGADILAIARAVKAVLEEARKQVPAAVRFDLTMDRSDDINTMVADLENNMFAAFVLVMLVVLVFMGWRSSLVVALAVPLSMLMSFAVINAMGYTLNMIVLFSLVLAVGMLVDNAIVIVENIYRHRQLGYGRVEAAMKGTSEVAWPVITSTLTTVAAFLPMLFWPGIIGDFMKYLPITVIVVLLSSLVVAMVVSPVVCTLMRLSGAREDAEEHGFKRAYRRFLNLALTHRFVTISLSALLLVAMVIVYAKRGPGVEFFPDIDPKRGIVNIRAPQGTNVKQSDMLARIAEQRVAKYQEELEFRVASVGSEGGKAAMFGEGSGGGPHVGNLTLLFRDYEERQRPSAEVLADVRRDLADLYGAEIKVEKEKEGPPTGAPVTVRVSGKDFAQLQQISEQARAMIADVSGLVNLRSDLEATRPELVFKVDRRRAMANGVNTAVVGNFLKTSVFGSKVGVYRQYNDEYDITVRLPESQRRDIEDIFRLHVPNSEGKPVPLSSLGQFEYKGGFGTINRISQKRVVTLTADNEGRLGADVLADVMDRLSPLGPSRWSAADVLDWKALIADVAGQKSPVGRQVWTALDRAGRKAFADAGGRSDLDDQTKARLANALNQASRTARVYDAQAYAGVALSPQGQELAARFENLSRDERARLGRLALEAAYGGVLKARPHLELPAGYTVTYAGEKEDQDESSKFLMSAFIFALLLIVLILVAQFNTLLVPLIIMTTVVLSLVGVFIGLIVTDMPFGIIMTGIAVISLAGVVVNNAIVLLDYTRQLQARGMELVEASVEAGATRLRPVLLTAGTTVIGMLPTALGMSFDIHTFEWVTKSESSLWWKSMAVAMIFGLGFATFLTLVFVPTLYVSLHRLAVKLGFGKLAKPHAESESEALDEQEVAAVRERPG